MQRWRHDPLTDRWVVRAPRRADRPRRTTERDPAARDGCPFCPGNEARTPAETARTSDGRGGWTTRTFPNLYPAVVPGEDDRGLQVDAPATGRHEVVVTTPDHDATWADLGDDGAWTALRALVSRVDAHLDLGHAHSEAFVNQGAAAGASIDHPHGQVVALDVVPPVTRREVDALAEDRCVLCAHPRDLTVTDQGGVRVIAPSWSWAEDELIVLPTAHQDLRGNLAPVAGALRDVLLELRHHRGDPPYNLLVHPTPRGATSFHGHVHVVPRTSTFAGFELSTGLQLSSADPDGTAHDLGARLSTSAHVEASASNANAAELMQ